jgi:hypothetical protein
VRTTIFGVMMALAAVTAAAQTPDSRGSIGVIGGAGKTLDDEGSLGRGWLVGGAVDRVVFGTTRAEFSLELLTHDRDSGYFQSNGRTVIGGVSLVHRFGSGNTEPYLFGGITVGHDSGTNYFNGSPSPRSNADAGLRFGFGVAFRAGDRWEIGPEIRLNGFFIDNDADPATLPSFGVRFGWRM